VFTAQVIDEDNESPPNVEEEKQEHKHVPEDPTTEDNDVPNDPQGSQYESDREEYPLEEYEEYVEIDGDEDEDADVVYIRSGRITDDGDVTDDIADTSSVSDSASTLVGSTNTSMDLAEIPPGMTPYEVILSLPEDTRIEIYTRRKTEEEPNWTPPHNIIDVERWKKSPTVSNRMLHMGYSWTTKYMTLNGFRAWLYGNLMSSKNSPGTVYQHRFYANPVANVRWISEK